MVRTGRRVSLDLPHPASCSGICRVPRRPACSRTLDQPTTGLAGSKKAGGGRSGRTLPLALGQGASPTTRNVVASELEDGLQQEQVVEDAIFPADKVAASIDGMRAA